jgi:tRNA-dihydrouridine synthase
MVGRMAVVKPWIFRELSGHIETIDYSVVWKNYYNYVLEDFPPEKGIGRIKEFSKYFAQNFLFGHELHRIVQSASSLELLNDQTLRFLDAHPAVTEYPTVIGL